MSTLRIYLRRSKADRNHQEFSLDVQKEGARLFVVEVLLSRGESICWDERVAYIDDDRAGDDFLGRDGLRRLLADAKAGDIIVCRDQSRLGRDALETTLAIRTLVCEKRARLFYYVTGQEVPFANAIDQATTFIQGTGHQMELEAIRSRTREALRSRARVGRSAGGKCYGYKNQRQTDGSGREYTVLVVLEREAEIVRQIFTWYVHGCGLKQIAIRLNESAVPSPVAGQRGSGSWSPSCIRAMLRNERYRGVSVHGLVERKRQGGRRRSRRADPGQVIRVEMPHLRIVSDKLWYAAQEMMTERGKNAVAPGPACKHPLSGIARCGVCGRAIGVRRTKISGGQRVPAYGCLGHHLRGNAVCAVATVQPVEEVEGALIGYLQREVLTSVLVERVVQEIRAEVDRQLQSPPDVAHVERELADARSQVKKLVRLGALAGDDDLPELATELRKVNARVRTSRVIYGPPSGFLGSFKS